MPGHDATAENAATHRARERADLRHSRLWFWGACIVGLAARLVALDARPLHHDEGMVAWLLHRLFEGHRFAYDPGRFHGPFLIFFSAPFVGLLGESVEVLRLPAALASAAMLPLLLPLRGRLGMAGVTTAAWLLALSPAFVAYGRDLIPETFLVLLTLALLVAACDWLERRRPRSLVLAGLALGLLATVKESYALTVAIMAMAAVVAWILAERRPRLAALCDDLTPGTLVLAALAVAVPYLLLYSSFFTHPHGVLASASTFAVWAGKGMAGAGHAKPWDYYLRLLGSFEPAITALAVAGGWLALRRRLPFASFCAVWAAGELLAYSVFRYKTPWLVLNVLLPASLLAGLVVRKSFRPAAPATVRVLVAVTLAVGLAWSAWRTLEVSFLRFDDERLGLVYVPTHRDVFALLAYVRDAAGRVPASRPPTGWILGSHAWPVPWYLRDLTGVRRSLDVPPRPDGDILIVEARLEGRLLPLLRRRYRRRPFLLRPRAPFVVYVDERLAAPK